MSWLLRLAFFVVIAVLVYAWLRRGLARTRSERRHLSAALTAFQRDRLRLAESFLAAGRAANEAQRERWRSCRLDEQPPRLARDLATAELVALAGVRVEGEPSEGTAVFHWRSGRWTTEGRLAAGLTPGETLDRYRDTLEPV